MLLRRRAQSGDKPLLVIGGRDYTASALVERAGQAALMLAEAGVTSGDRVAILCGNRIEFFDLLLGTIWLGAIAVPVNRAARGPQLRHILANSGAKALAIEPEALTAIGHIARAGLAVDHLWVMPGGAEPLTESVGEWRPAPLPALGDYREPARRKPSDLATIIYTSGTTGPSKGVCCPQAQFFWWAVHSIDILDIGPEDVLLTTLPLFHVNALGSFFQALLGGATLVALERFSASGFSRSLVEHRATVTCLLGAMVSILLATPGQEGDARHQVRRALAPGVPAQFHAPFTTRFGMTLIDDYGSTESNFVIGDSAADQKPGSMGRLRPGFEAIVADEDDNALPDGSPGELLLRASEPYAFASGYFGLPEQTMAAWRNLWFHTGDRVRRDADGQFIFMGRIKDAIRRRGENISAFEVEQVLLSHPDIAQAGSIRSPRSMARMRSWPRSSCAPAPR